MLRRKSRGGPPLVGIIADDLSGASDAAAGFLGSGHAIRVERARTDNPHGASVLALSTNTRDVPPTSVEKAMGPALARIGALGPRVLVKKVDSTLRGHLALELELVRAASAPELVVIAPAFPAQGRRVIDGRLHIDGHGDDALPGVVDAFDLAGAAVTRVSRAVLGEGTLDVDRAMSSNQPLAIVADSADDADLDALVAAVMRSRARTLWVGSGGLTAALARALPRVDEPARAVPGPTGPILVVVGSANERSHRQFDELDALPHLRCRRIETDLLLGPPEAFHRRRSELAATLAAGFDLAVELERAVTPHLAQRLELAVAALIAPLLSPGIGVVLTGGAVAEAVLDRAQVSSFLLLEEVSPGIPLGFAADEQLSIVTKAGGFGDDRALVDTIELLRERRGIAEVPPNDEKAQQREGLTR